MDNKPNQPVNDESDCLFELINNISEEQESDIFFYSGPMGRGYDDLFIQEVTNKKHYKNVLLFLTTYGGDADAAYRIARTLQHSYEKFTIFLYTDCKSAGTLLTLGAHEIIMSEFAEIGPLDVQLFKADELGERSSGLDWIESLNLLRDQSFRLFEEHFLNLRLKSGYQLGTKLCSDIAAKITIGLLSPIYSQIEPVQLGDIERSISIAYAYGERLQERSLNLKENTLTKLITNYPSHGFVIDFFEAVELFHHIRQPTENEKALAELLQPLAYEHVSRSPPIINCLSEGTFSLSDRGRQNEDIRDEGTELPEDAPIEGDGEKDT